MYSQTGEPREILRRIMAARGFDQATLARSSGVPQPTISRYPAGKHRHLSTEHMLALGHALGVTVSELLGEVPLASAIVRECQRALAHMSEEDRRRAVAVLQAMAGLPH